MKDTERRVAAKAFSEYWKNKGYYGLERIVKKCNKNCATK